MGSTKAKNHETKTSCKKKAKAEWMWIEQIYYKIDEIQVRLDKLEKWIKEHTEGNKAIVMRIDELEKSVKLIRKKLNT